ncbi:MAG: hypothetical protein Q4C54_00860 [Clostridia bacterium]|nr:hypothetical protein [Clostridia bacterium]
MTGFALFPQSIRLMAGLWSFLLMTLGLFLPVYSLYQKRFGFAALSALPLVIAHMLWQICTDWQQLAAGRIADCHAVTRWAMHLPWTVWLAVLMLLTAVLLFMLRSSIRYGQTAITPAAIKLCADGLPSGVCYWLESGQVIFANSRMNTLCAEITHQALMNGNTFRDALTQDYYTVSGRVWRFVCREVTMDGHPLQEMLAQDVTEEYAKTEALRRDNRQLERINRELQSYQADITESVRRQEILQAKVNIHDEMNRLMLTTAAADVAGREAMRDILTTWQKNAVLLCMEAEQQKLEQHRLDALARQLNIRLTWHRPMPAALTEAQQALVCTAAREAIINAVKHAGAENLSVAFEDTEEGIVCTFENDGKLPQGPIRFSGGLGNLARLAQQQHTRVTAEADTAFRVKLHFGTGETHHPPKGGTTI